ncbi:MAG: alcohol dehydrogenase catalytic domain-containing protein [Phycisphaerae bacterium]
MQALVVDQAKPGIVTFVPDYPDPSPAPGEVLVRVDLAGICSTDLEIVRGYMNYSGVLGHEFVGTVVRGSDALCGRRVVAEINCVGPGSRARDADARKHARERTVVGITGRDGAFAEYLVVPVENCHVLPNEVSDRQAVFTEPLAAACQVVKDHPVEAETRAAVLGTGRLGILCAQVLAARGCRLSVMGRNSDTLALCRRIGLPTRDVASAEPSADYDLVVECTGSPDGLRLALRLVGPRGTIVLKSTYARVPDVDLAPIVVHEIVVAGNRCGPFPEALRLLREGRVRVDEMIHGIFPLARGEEAFAAARDRRNLKILLQPGAS